MKREVILSAKEVAKFLRKKPLRWYFYGYRFPQVGELIHYRCRHNSTVKLWHKLVGNDAKRLYGTIMVRDWFVNHLRRTYNEQSLWNWEYCILAKRNKWDYMTYLDEKALE